MNSTVCFLRSSPKYTEQLNKYCTTWQALHYFIILYHKRHLKPFSIKEIYSQKKKMLLATSLVLSKSRLLKFYWFTQKQNISDFRKQWIQTITLFNPLVPKTSETVLPQVRVRVRLGLGSNFFTPFCNTSTNNMWCVAPFGTICTI